jgi:hypothetical protein
VARARRTFRPAALVVLAALLATSRAVAAPSAPARAREDFREGLRLRKAGKLDQACDRFERSYNEGAEPGALYNLARCREQQGRLAEAYQELFTLAQRAVEARQTETAQAMLAECERLAPKLARIELVRRDDARSEVTAVTVDGSIVLKELWNRPVYVMPGVHQVAATHGDGQTVTRTSADLAAGAAERLELDDPPPPLPTAAPPADAAPMGPVDHGRRVAAYVVFGVGAGLAVAGGVTGALSFRRKSTATGICGGSLASCNGDSGQANDDLASARHLATASTVTFVAAGAAVAAAVVLLVSESHEAAPVAHAAGVAVAPFALTGWF